jgi:hypothetical protein
VKHSFAYRQSSLLAANFHLFSVVGQSLNQLTFEETNLMKARRKSSICFSYSIRRIDCEFEHIARIIKYHHVLTLKVAWGGKSSSLEPSPFSFGDHFGAVLFSSWHGRTDGIVTVKA